MSKNRNYSYWIIGALVLIICFSLIPWETVIPTGPKVGIVDINTPITDSKNIVKDFAQEKIVLKTEKDAETDPEMDFDNQGSTDKVKQMAKSAMNRRK